jgi:DNA-binding transcriptional LysR family regulator
MRSEQLEYIAAVARLGSFRRAAEQLHISQPALSATVRNLERELGVSLLDRGRAGAQVSDEGRELLPLIVGAIEAIEALRRAATVQHSSSSIVRIGTVNAGTVNLLTPAIMAFRELHEHTHVEVVGAQQLAIDTALREGGLDLGIITCLDGDDMPPDLETTLLVTGRPIVCVRPDNPLAAQAEVSPADLLTQPLILMRSGYLMHRFVHRLLADHPVPAAYTTDGGEMGKLLVAEGLGVTVLPDFSVVGDPMERAGLIAARPIAGDNTEVQLVVRRRRSQVHPRAASDLNELLVASATAYSRP